MTAAVADRLGPTAGRLVARATRIAIAAGGILAAGLVGTVFCRIVAGFWVPSFAYFQAAVNGAIAAMFAVGLVLIYRAGRIVNFAQGALGVISGVLFALLVLVEGWNFFLAFPVAVAAAAGTGLLVELLVIRRLSKAPRLALTVVTIGIAQILVGVAAVLPVLLFLDPDEDPPIGAIPTPFSGFEFNIGFGVFSGNHIMVMVVAALVMAGMAAFFRLSSVGIAVRGAAENDDRAALLGINVNNLSTLVWVMAATLSGIAAVLDLTVQATAFGFGVAGAFSYTTLLRGLAAAVVGRMENLPITVAAAMGIAVFEQAMFWTFDNTALIDAALLLLIVGVFLGQRNRMARTDEGVTGSWQASVEIRGVPHELRDLPSVRAGLRRATLLIAAVLLAYPWVMSPAQTSLGSVYVIYGIVVISLVVLTGWGGQISLGQFAFVAVGGVIGGALTSSAGMPFPIALLLGSLAGAAVAVLVGLPAMRIKGLFLAVTTLAFAVATSTVFLNARWFGWLIPTEIERPQLLFLDTNDERVYFYMCLVALGFALWVAQGLRKARAGRVLIAMRENERTAQAYSINRIRTRLATFAVSGFLAAFAGVLLAHQQHSVRPQAFTPEMSVQIFLIAIIGGLGSVPGALTGVVYFALVNIFLPGNLQLLASGVGALVVLMFYPGGLGGAIFALRDAWLRRVAMRNRIFVPSLIGDYRVLDGEHTKVALAPKYAPTALTTNGAASNGDAADQEGHEEVPVRYRIPSVIGVRGESQQGRGWRWQ